MPRHGSAAAGAEVDLGPVPTRGRSLAGWSIRRKLTLLVMIPLVALLAGGGVLVTQIALDYRQAHTARIYADTLLPTLQTVAALNTEFNDTNAADQDARTSARAETDSRVNALRGNLEDLSGVDSSNSTIATDAENVGAELEGLTNTRGLVDRLVASRQIDDPAGRNQIQSAVEPILTNLETLLEGVTSELARTTPDATAADGAQFVAALSRAERSAVDERLLMAASLAQPSTMNTQRLRDLSEQAAGQREALASANLTATASQKADLQSLEGDDNRLTLWRNSVADFLQDTPVQPTARESAVASGQWTEFSVQRIARMSTILFAGAEQTAQDARDAETASLWRAGLFALAVLVTLAVVTTLLATIARSVTVPLRRLRSGAVDVASVQLPAAVARIEQDGTSADISLPPVLPADSYAGPETIEVARAVDDLGAEAVRLATAQVRLRRALDEAFVSMSRRSQAMVEKQLGIIDELESQEQDPDQLRNLFRLDHLAARMRRYNDNLLVLAGSAVRTRATAPVKVAELFRAATSEMEQYERVRLQPVSGASISGTVAGELVHLLAELLDNAAMYSPPSSAIVLSAAFTADGGLQIEVLDAGVGIAPGELDRLNARLAQPESIDTQVPSRMGLFVVARLARRGGFGVMLQGRPDASGTVAMVRIPPPLVIGAPGSTGETPVQHSQFGDLRPMTPPNGLPQRNAPAALSGAAAALGSAPEAYPQAPQQPVPAAQDLFTAEVTHAPDTEGGDSPLPRRVRPPRTSQQPGLPPAQIAAQSTMTPPGGLFTPATPVEAGEPREDREPREPRYDDLRDRSADRSGDQGGYDTFGDGGFDAPDRFGAEPAAFGAAPDTSPNGIPQQDRPASTDAGLPIRTSGGDRRSPYAGVNPATGEPMGPLQARGAVPDESEQQSPPTSSMSTGAITTSGSTSASALPSVGPVAPAAGHPLDADTPAGGLPRRGGRAQEPLTAPSGQPKTDPAAANPSPADAPAEGSGAAPAAWDEELPTELAARAAAQYSYVPADPNAPMIGDDVSPDRNDPTPIFDQISVWFSSDPATGNVPVLEEDGEDVIDLRERQPSSRWQSLGDQRWLATNARASAAPTTAGTTEEGLPRRRPGANLLPSAASAAAAGTPAPHRSPAPVPERISPAAAVANADPDLVRGRLGSYQRGLATARQARQDNGAEEQHFDPVGASLFAANREPGDDAGQYSGENGGDQ